MKRTVGLAPKARADLDGIRDYSLEKWGQARAHAYMSSFHAALRLIDEYPGMARDARNVRPGLVKYSVGSHIQFMRIDEKFINVVRILHQSMDFPRHFQT